MDCPSSHLNFLCGPLIRYTYTEYDIPDNTGGIHDEWHGTLLVVLADSAMPTLTIETDVAFATTTTRLLNEDGHSFWRFDLAFNLEIHEVEVNYTVFLTSFDWKYKNNVRGKEGKESSRGGSFWLPARAETMRIMFYSCNGNTANVHDPYFHPALWNDVMRVHSERPFHVMIGGGDQIYSDLVEINGPLKPWHSVAVHQRSKTRVSPIVAQELDSWYFKNYCQTYSIPEFAKSAASIPSVQIFDDHDIIDGYGSYHDNTMRSDYYIAIGRVAWKYYLLFQQHASPSVEPRESRPWVLGKQKGPYIQEFSRSICTKFGKRVIFYGLDCRVERTIERVCYEETYNAMFDKLADMVTKGETQHLLLLLGVPVAYPRLTAVEKLLRYTDVPVRALNAMLGVGEKYFNSFDGSAELLDDLNDHWCAGTHIDERDMLIETLQSFAKRHEIRITILSGDVHLACIGRFFSSEKIPQNKDHRYIVNIISSAMTSAPPPKVVAKFLDRRNKVHELGGHTQENLMRLFDKNLMTGKPKKKGSNRTTMPARNYCTITEHHDPSPSSLPYSEVSDWPWGADMQGGSDAIVTPRRGCKSILDVSIRAEINPQSKHGETRAYAFSIPALDKSPVRIGRLYEWLKI